jgi:predicted ATPase
VFARGLVGIGQVRSGRTTEGIALIREGIDGLLKVGTRVSVPFFINNLAASQKLDGAIDEALATVEQALQFNPEERVHRPDMLRLRGELHLERGHEDAAEADFRDSILLARSMGAKAWELRTAMSLARLLTRHGRRQEAHEMLAEIYNWFTEGFDTADLKDAKTLLTNWPHKPGG